MNQLSDLRVGMNFRFFGKSTLYEVKYISCLANIEYYEVGDSDKIYHVDIFSSESDIIIYKELK